MNTGNPKRNSEIPLLDLARQYNALSEQLDAAVLRVCRSQRFILGAEVEAFEREIAKFIGVEHAIGVSSGTDALLMALMALGVGAGHEVITTPYTFFATAGAIARLGARPVFVDIDPESFHMQVSAVERNITPRTRAVIPVHLFGRCVAWDGLEVLGSSRQLPIIEDAAQAIGARFSDGRRAGAKGAVGCFSFFPSKNLGGFGDGGLVTTGDGALAERLRSLRVHGEVSRYHHRYVGGNFRLDALQAAVLRVKLPFLEEWAEKRRANAERYEKLFREEGLVDGRRIIALPADDRAGYHVYNQYVIRVSDRDRLQRFLTDRKIGTAVYYPRPLHLQECFSNLGYKRGDFPESEKAAEETLALPIFPELMSGEQERVVEGIAEFYRSRS